MEPNVINPGQPEAVNYQPAPTPPPPVTEIKPENIHQLMTDQFTKASSYHNELLKTKAEHDKYRATVEEQIKVNSEKVQAYDALADRTKRLNEFAGSVLKNKYESLDKEFIAAYGEDLKLEELLKDPLAGLEAIEKNLKIFNSVVEKYKASKPDGTRGAPANVQAEIVNYSTRAEWVAAARAHLTGKA